MKTPLIILFLVSGTFCFSQTAEVTLLEKTPDKIAILPGINADRFKAPSGNIYTYNFEFDSEGKFLGNSDFCVDIDDIPLKNGFVELKKGSSKNDPGKWVYIPYADPTNTKVIDFKSLINTDDFWVISKHFPSDYFIVKGQSAFYMISEQLEIIHTFEVDDNLGTNIKKIEVLPDGCVYVIYVQKGGITLKKVDVVSKKLLTLDIAIPKGLALMSAFPFRYNTIMASPESFYLSINQDGSKVFFGLCPGVEKMGYNGASNYIKSKSACFYIINGADFKVELKSEFDFSDDHLAMSSDNDNGISSPYIEDVYFMNNDVFVAISNRASYGVNPIAIYKISQSKNQVSMHGVINNIFDDNLARNRDHGRFFYDDNKLLFIYPIKMVTDKVYKPVNKTYQAIQIVDVTDGSFDAITVKEGLEGYKLDINMISGSWLSDGNLLFLSSIFGVSSTFGSFHSIKLILK